MGVQCRSIVTWIGCVTVTWTGCVATAHHNTKEVVWASN